VCEQCGVVRDHDFNASLNIRDEALRLRREVPAVASSGPKFACGAGSAGSLCAEGETHLAVKQVRRCVQPQLWRPKATALASQHAPSWEPKFHRGDFQELRPFLQRTRGLARKECYARCFSSWPWQYFYCPHQQPCDETPGGAQLSLSV
jgi:hypothetical protein